jgi:hypothetical protein
LEGGVSPFSDCPGTNAASTAGLRFASFSFGTFSPSFSMFCTALMSESAGLSTTATAVQLGELPCGGSIPLLPEVHHSVARSNMNPVRPAAATRNPSRPPMFVASSKYTEPQNNPTAATTVRIPMIVGFQMFASFGPSAAST